MKKNSRKIKLPKTSLFDGLGMAYKSAAIACNSLDVDTPDSMGYEVHEFLKKLITETGGDVTEFVRRKLGYKDFHSICDALASEQIDGVAIAIYNIERRRQGVIIGDQTGIGKGRQAAAVIRYAVQQGLKPIFITEKPNLFSDLYRDMEAIGSGKLKPFIVNSDEEKTKVKDENGDVVYTALPNAERNKAIAKAKLPAGFDYIMLTYSQLNSSKFVKKGSAMVLESYSPKANFVFQLADDNIIIMDESHNASGDSNTGRVLQNIVSRTRGVCFLSATFAKRPDNMPVYAIKTAMQDAALTKDQLIEAITRGGVALQEVISSQLVSYGQMIRRERSYEGIEVNYIYLTEREKEHRAISDNVTQIIRDIIQFQEDFINPEIESLNLATQLENPNASEVKGRKGTEKGGVSNTEYFSKVFQVINQMLFAVKAEDVAERAIMRLREGKKPVIAFSNTMGSFLETITDESGAPVSDGSKINADFGTVLMRGLDGILRYTTKIFDEDAEEMKTEYGYFDINDFSNEARAIYNNIVEKIKQASTGIVISPIDLIKQRIQEAGFTVAEVTGRKLALSLKEVKAGSKESLLEIQVPGVRTQTKNSTSKNTKIKLSDLSPLLQKLMPPNQQKAIIGNPELSDVIAQLNKDVADLPQLYATEKAENAWRKLPGNASKPRKEFEKEVKPILHYFLGGTDLYILEYEPEDNLFYGFTVLNGDWEMAEYGYTSVDEIMSLGQNVNVRGNKSFAFKQGIELDFFWNRDTSMYSIKNSHSELDGIFPKHGCSAQNLGRITPGSGTTIVGTVQNRKKENVFDAFRRFNDNEVDVLMINQAGATGASAHAMPTKKVKTTQVKQRVMIVLQAELDINKEVQKRGRVNRTGQIIKPIYDYVISNIPAEKRLMMMLQKKLKSLDANTSSNQKQSEALLTVEDFLNKYGDVVVKNYLYEHKDLNEKLGDLLGLGESSGDDQKQAMPENLAHKASGRVAVLDTATQEKFYTDILESYNSYVTLLQQQDDYDLEVETMNLDADILEKSIINVGRGGSSAFGDNTVLNRCEVNILKKPLKADELNAILVQNLDGKQWRDQANTTYKNFSEYEKTRLDAELADIKSDSEQRITNIENEKGFQKIHPDDTKLRNEYREKRNEDLQEARRVKINKAIDRSNNRSETLVSYLKFFFTGRKCYFPNDIESDGKASTLAIFTGYKFNLKSDNPYAPSAIKAGFAICSAKKYIELPLSYIKEIQAIRGASADTSTSENWWDNNELRDEWTDYAKKYAGNDRGIRHIITGNLLQAYGSTDERYKGKLISFSCNDGSIRKGILLPDTFAADRDANNNFAEKLITVPIYKARKPIASLSRNGIISSNNSKLSIGKRGDDIWEFILSKSKSVSGDIYLDTNVLQHINGNNFNSSGNTMIGMVTWENLHPVLKVLQDRHGVTVELREWQFDLIQEEIQINIGSDVVPLVTEIKPDGTSVEIDLLALEFEALELELSLLEIAA